MDDNDDALSKRATQERLLISKLSREDLEDKYLKSYDENLILKKHARKQEDRIKMMATKLIRLVNDRKKSLAKNNLNDSSSKRMRDVDTEEYIAELQSKLSDLEQQNKRLKENLQISKIQLQTLQAQKNPVSNIYSNVTSRIDTGLPKRDPSFTRNIRTLSSNRSGNLSSRSVATPSYPNLVPNRQLQELEYENTDLKNKLEDYESQIISLQDQLHQQKLDHEEVLSKLKSQVSHEHLVSVQENIDQIRLQRELKDKVNQYSELFSKFSNLTQQHVNLKENHDRLLEEIERYNQQLKQEQQRSISLKTELKNASQSNREILELKERIEDLSRENQVLNEANQKLVNSAFSLEREREFREKERALKIQIAQLEATLKADVGEKGSILDRLNSERDQYDKLNNEMRETQIKYYEMKQKYDDMNEKMLFLSKESNIDFSEIEEALIIVKERRANKNTDDFLNIVDSEKLKVYQRKIVDLEASLAETVGELDKSRHLLITQVKINDDYKKEVFLIQNKMEENKAEFDSKMIEYAQLLDIRAARIKKLERQLKDIAYGTRQVRITQDLDEAAEGPSQPGKRRDSYSFVGAPLPHQLDNYITANLERGQNIFEIHVTKVTLTPEAIRIMNETDPSTFCTIEFFEHELQTTPIVKGQRPEYNFTSQYIVRADDFFLHYLQKKTSTIEFHQAIGSDYETRAVCQLSFRELIDKETSRIHGSAKLTCINSNNVGISFGTLEYWARLIVPVDQAFRLYKERTKALGYLATNAKATDQQPDVKMPIGKSRSADNMNELNINILRCSKLQALAYKTQPSPYCVYKFYDFSDHDTEIIKASNSPEFNDHKSFAVPMDIDLDKYLKNDALEIYIFDDNQDENDPQYLGMAKVPLIGLAHDKDIKGTFELKKVDGTSNGTVDVALYWQYSYLPPAASTFAASGSKQPTNMKGKSLSLMPGEKLEEPMSLAQKAEKMGVKFSAKQNQQEASSSQNKPDSKQGSKAGSKQSSAAGSKPGSPQSKGFDSPQQLKPDENGRKTSSQSNDDNSIGNSTLHHKPDYDPTKLSKSKKSPSATPDNQRPTSRNSQSSFEGNTHYNDTMFGDEPGRTYSPNELDSLRHVYQNNVAHSDDEEKEPNYVRESKDQNDANNDNENEIEEDIITNSEENGLYGNKEEDEEITANTQSERNFKNYNATIKSDDDLVIDGRTWDPNNTNKLPKEGNNNNVIIEILNFTLKENSQVLKREDIQRLFVSMEFLNYDTSELETDITLPKPEPNKPANFNFRKIFQVDAENNLDKRQQLANMILDKDHSTIRFVVVSDPPHQDAECEDIGYAFIDINDIMDKNENYINKEITLFDANDLNIKIGKMTVTVEILEALNAIKREIQESMEDTI